MSKISRVIESKGFQRADKVANFLILNAPWFLMFYGIILSAWASRGGVLHLDDIWTALTTIIVAGVLIISSRLYEINKTIGNSVLTGTITAVVTPLEPKFEPISAPTTITTKEDTTP